MPSSNRNNSKRRREGNAKAAEEAKSGDEALMEEIMPAPKVGPSQFKYEDYGGFGERLDVRIPEVNPWNPDNSLTDEERFDRSKSLFTGASLELDCVIPQALKDRAQRDEAKAETAVTRELARSACKLLDAALGMTISQSCLFQHVRPSMGKPGEALSEANKGILLYQVMQGAEDEFLAEEKEFRLKYPQYVPKPANLALAPVEVPAVQVLDEQVSHYATRIEDPERVVRANLNAKHFLLSLQALCGTQDGDPSFKALVLGLVCHHMNGLEGDFNGRDNEAVFAQGEEEIFVQGEEERDG